MSERQPAPEPKYLRMADLCQASGMSRPTVAKYLKLGLLPPPISIAPTVHLYNESHVRVLCLVRQFQEQERLSPPEIKEALASGRAPAKARVPARAQGGLSGADESGGKRQMIIDKAVRLFSIHGYENVKISDITDAIQIGKGTFYLYFKDKKELLHECFLEVNSLLSSSEQDVEVINEPDIVLRMKKRWLYFQKYYPHFGGLVQLLQTTVHSDDPVIRKRAIDSYNTVIRSIREDIDKSQSEGKIAQMDPDLTAYAILGIMENITFRMTHNDNHAPDAGANVLEELVRRVLLPIN